MTTYAEQKADAERSIDQVLDNLAARVGVPRSWVDAVFRALMLLLQSTARVAGSMAVAMRAFNNAQDAKIHQSD
jgi:hypothetical protein